MPELAEVDTIARQAHQALAGQRLHTAHVFFPEWVKQGRLEQLEGLRLQAVQRWGKRLLLTTPGPVAVISLGMTGALELEPPAVRKHLLAELDFEQGSLYYLDPRRFGSCLVFETLEQAQAEMVKRIGVDAAATLSRQQLRDALLRGSGQLNVKAALLDQSRLAGIGNYLADEMLYGARINPSRSLSSLREPEWDALNQARREVIERALAARGLSFSDYRDAHGQQGEMMAQLKVYGREGLECERCQSLLRKTVVAGRGTVYCPLCQPPQ